MRVLIVGCGYVGLPLGAELASQGHQVSGMRRGPSAAHELNDAGIRPLVCDITRPEELSKLSADYDWVINCVASTRGGPEEYRKARATC